MAVTIFGVNRAILKTKKQRDRLKNGATNYVKDTVRKVLKDLVLNAPQWSGNTAASWAIEVTGGSATGHPTELYRANWREVDDRLKGHPQAWAVARQNNVRSFNAIRWNSKIKLVNKAPFAAELATLTDAEIEAREKRRPNNYTRGDAMYLETVAMKYKLASNAVALGILKDANRTVDL